MQSSEIKYLERINSPVLLIDGPLVRFANSAAKDLLGSHIIGQDLRIAIRNPEALAAINAPQGGRYRIGGLGSPGSSWLLSCHPLDGGRRMITLDDLSIHVSVAKAHTDFVANASHELRTPLAAVLGYVEALESPKIDEPTRARFLGTIRHEAQRMQALVEDLMSLSRIEAGKHELPTDIINLADMARECLGEFSARAKIELAVSDDQSKVAGDRAQLAQVLRNLIDNAIKYGEPDAPITVSIESAGADKVEISVRNEGEGIPPESLPRLTERFYRADTSRSRAAGGTGLGLAIVKHIVERHRGWFDIASGPAGGTTASILLPASRV
jgi:two-component system phosphate regulon sensor histidine kinase PhoR